MKRSETSSKTQFGRPQYAKKFENLQLLAAAAAACLCRLSFPVANSLCDAPQMANGTSFCDMSGWTTEDLKGQHNPRR